MPDTSLYIALTGDQFESLAKVSYMMQFMTNSDQTGVDLASNLLSLLKSDSNATYGGMPVVSLVGGASGNTSMDASGAERILSMFEYLPHAESPGFAALWLFFAVFSFVMVVMRFYIRQFLGGGLKKEDFLILAAWALAATYTITDASLIFTNHVDRYSWDLHSIDIRLHWKAETIGLFLFFIASALYKTALIVFYMELSPNKSYQRMGYGLLACTWIYTVLAGTWTWLWCQPYGYWDNPATMYCQTYEMANAYLTTLFVWDLVLDLAVLLLPMTVIHGLQLRSKDKALVYSLIFLGCAVCICAAGRISRVASFLKSNEQTRKALYICSWTLIEVHLGVACASAPMLRRCFIEVFPILKSTASRFTRSKFSSKQTLSASSGISRPTSSANRDTNKQKKQNNFSLFSTLRGGGSRSPSESMTEMTGGATVTTEVTQTEETRSGFYDAEKGQNGDKSGVRVYTSVVSMQRRDDHV